MLTGDRIVLRPVQRADLPAMRRWFDDPATMPYWAMPALATEQQFEADLLGRFATFDAAGYFTIVEPAGAPIGRIDFERLDMRTRSAEVGILIGEADARGQGYGTDAMRTLLAYLFACRRLHRVELTALVANQRAIRSYANCGFRVEGRLRDHVFFDGRFHDELLMSNLAQDFRSPLAALPGT